MQCDLRKPLPFSDDTQGYLRFVSAMPAPVALESGRPASDQGRFSIYTADPVETLKVGIGHAKGTSSSVSLAELTGQIKCLHQKYFNLGEQSEHPNKLPFNGGLAGFIGYPTLVGHTDMQIVSAYIGVYLWAIVVDHVAQSSWLVAHPLCPAETWNTLSLALADKAPNTLAAEVPATFALGRAFEAQMSLNEYGQAFDSIDNYIHSGDVYQVNLTQKFSAPCTGSALSAYLTLRQTSPGPYNAFIDLGSEALLCLSPERFLLCQDGKLETKPIKGTRQRLSDSEADRAQQQALLSSAKDRSENLMIVDLLRNDLGQVSNIGSVKVAELFALKTFSNVHHLVSTISAQLAPGLDGMDALNACFPGGSITGAPKLRAMEIIQELEVSQRGPYCGSVLYWDAAGRLDSNIAIRTLRWIAGASSQESDQIECWAGGGIVADSTKQEEYAECFHKVQNLLDVLSLTLGQDIVTT